MTTTEELGPGILVDLHGDGTRGVVVLWRESEGHGVRIFKTSIWNIPAGDLLAAGAFKEMRRPDLRPFKKAVYGN